MIVGEGVTGVVASEEGLARFSELIGAEVGVWVMGRIGVSLRRCRIPSECVILEKSGEGSRGLWVGRSVSCVTSIAIRMSYTVFDGSVRWYYSRRCKRARGSKRMRELDD